MADTLTNIGTVVSASAPTPATFDQSGYAALTGKTGLILLTIYLSSELR